MTAQKYDHVHSNLGRIFINNFTGGIAWGLGASVGVSLILAVLGILSKQLNLVPFVGTFVADVIEFINTTRPHLAQ